MSTADLQDKLTDSNLGNWFFLPINGSSISWEVDIDYALVNSSMHIKYQVFISLLSFCIWL